MYTLAAVANASRTFGLYTSFVFILILAAL